MASQNEVSETRIIQQNADYAELFGYALNPYFKQRVISPPSIGAIAMI